MRQRFARQLDTGQTPIEEVPILPRVAMNCSRVAWAPVDLSDIRGA
jgi:hypothetical protein